MLTQLNSKGEPLDDASYILEKLKEITDYDSTPVRRIKKYHEKTAQIYKDEIINKTIFTCAIHDILAPKRCILEYKLTKQHNI